jgi:hypothetical protein
MRDHRFHLQRVALLAAVLATVPYLALKLLWLTGSTIGTTDRHGQDELSSTRFVAGNSITVLLMVVAALFVVALTRSWASRVPARLVFVLAAGATGLLGPILVGLPVGIAVQAVATGEVEPAEDTGMAAWVFAVVYCGFGLLGLAMAVLVIAHVLDRWGSLISQPPRRPSWPFTVAGAVGLLPFGAAMIFWGLAGPGSSGPQGMDLPAQRTVLVVTGMLSVAAFVAPMLSAVASRWPRLAWLTAWTGCCIAAFQGPTQVLLAEAGKVEPAVAVIAVLSAPGACIYGLGVLKQRLSQHTDGSRSALVAHVRRPAAPGGLLSGRRPGGPNQGTAGGPSTRDAQDR